MHRLDSQLEIRAKSRTMTSDATPVYQGQFGNFTISRLDRLGVIAYRAGLTVAALCTAIGAAGVLLPLTRSLWLNHVLTPLYALFSFGLGLSLLTVHIYLAPLHRLLQLFWLVGSGAALWFAWQAPVAEPFLAYVYGHRPTILGVGFTFAALTGLYIKEAFCFQRPEALLLIPLLPALLLGHLFALWSPTVSASLLAAWALCFGIFAARKCWQEIPPDIGDKSVFAYLRGERVAKKVEPLQ